MMIDERAFLNAGLTRNVAVAVRVLDACPVAIEAQTVIRALHDVAVQLPRMQRRGAMGASVTARNRLTLTIAEEQNGSPDDGALEQIRADLIAPGGAVPRSGPQNLGSRLSEILARGQATKLSAA